MGKRGLSHATTFQKNPRFQLVGISSRDPARLAAAAQALGDVPTGSDPAQMAREVRPDLFCFCTPPGVRRELIELGIESGARLIAYEKPIALSTNEAIAIRDRVRSAGVKTVVIHQHR